jgi:hypothetical protein
MKNNKLNLLALFLLLSTGCAVSISDYHTTSRDQTAKYISKDAEDLDYDTGNYVLKTKGNGEVACINMGTEDGIEKGTKVEFYTIEKNRGEKYEVVFAKGRVFQPSLQTSWVYVDDYENVNLKVNHFVRKSADQTRTFGEKISDWFEWLFS